jgi:Tol biopolymer transport system component
MVESKADTKTINADKTDQQRNIMKRTLLTLIALIITGVLFTACSDNPVGSGNYKQGSGVNKIVYQGGQYGNDGIYIMNLDGSDNTFLVNEPGRGAMWPVISPDGTKIAYHSYTSEEIIVMNTDGSNRRVVGHGLVPRWSPDGSKLVYHSNRDGDMEIFMADINSGTEQQLTRNGSSDTQAHFSPDGRMIAFTSGRDGVKDSEGYTEARLYVMNADGSNQKRLSTNEADLGRSNPWSPDSRRLAYGGNNKITLIDADGRNEETIDGHSGYAQACWSPDGKKVLATGGDGPYGIVLFELKTGHDDVVATYVDGTFKAMSWTADGQRIIFAKKDQIHSIRPDGTDDRVLATGTNPMISPAGTR